MSHTISFHTFGCRLNQSETAAMENRFTTAGYKIVPIDKPASVAVINTCTVTENGDADTRRLVSKLSRFNPSVKIALVGCQAQIQKEKLTELPNVRWVVGNARKMELLEIIEENADPLDKRVIAPTIPKAPFTIPSTAIALERTRANLKIQDGCDFFCSFCEIPYARGRGRSRVFEDILREANSLAGAGYKEIVLTGINIGTYDFEGKTLMDVIDTLEQIPTLERLRISSIEPTTIPLALIDKMALSLKGKSKLCRHLHIPLQSGDDAVLKAMRRKYSIKDFRDLINLITERVPQVCLGTDIIVGFPTEDSQAFKESERIVQDMPLHYLHVFSYSARSLAKSRLLEGSVLPQEIEVRSRTLRELSARKRKLFYQSLLGRRQEVLFEGNESPLWQGLTDNYVPVEVNSTENLGNQIKDVALKEIQGLKILGEVR